VIRVEVVDFVSIPTRDVDRAVAFYRDVLGLPVSEVTDGEVEAPNVTFSFWNPERDGELFQPNTAGIALRVPDVEAACREFEAAGGEVIGIEDSGVCHMGFCKDLDGNVLILHRRYAPRSRGRPARTSP
jgi:catechol 2,3-dioxygenase-like lactoylglutathione lyase family enzyme